MPIHAGLLPSQHGESETTDLGIPNRFNLKSSRFSPYLTRFLRANRCPLRSKTLSALVHFSAFEVGLENLGIGQVFRIALEQVAIKDGQVG